MTALRRLVRSPIGPTLTALVLALISAPFVAFAIVRESVPPWIGPFDEPVDPGIAIAIACIAVIAGGLVGGTIGGRLLRRSPVAGLLVAVAVAWPIAIATLPMVPTLLGVEYRTAFGCISSCNPTIRAGDLASGAISYAASVFSGVFLIVPPVGALALAIAAWVASRRHRPIVAIVLGLSAVTSYNFWSIVGSSSWHSLGGAEGPFALLVIGAVMWVALYWPRTSSPSGLEATRLVALLAAATTVVAGELLIAPIPPAPYATGLQMTVRDAAITVVPAVVPAGAARVVVDDPEAASGSSLCLAGPFASAPAAGQSIDADRGASCVDRPAARWDLVQLNRGFYVFFVRSASTNGPLSRIEVRAPPGTELMKETFEYDDGTWPSDATDESRTAYADGGYQVTIIRPNHTVWQFSDDQFGDSRVEIDATALDVDGKFGLLCRYANRDFYAFTVTSTGEFAIARHLSDAWTTLIEGQSPAIHRTVPGDNHLRAECVGQRLAFYANDVLLGTTSDASLRSGGSGWLVGTFEEGGADVRFDNFAVFQT
jgi:hypothetical protein